jgi:hypothetical protein
MSDPIFSPDGQWMWTGAEWVPAPPNSEIEVPETSNHVENNDSLSNPYHISVDKNYKYKIAGIFLALLSFLFPYIGSNSPFSIQFQGSKSPIIWNGHEGFEPSMLEVFILVFTEILAVSLPYMIIIISSFVIIKIFLGHEDSPHTAGFVQVLLRLINPRTAGFVQVSLCLILMLGVIVNSVSPEYYQLEDFGLGYLLGLTSGILLFVKGRFCPILEE